MCHVWGAVSSSRASTFTSGRAIIQAACAPTCSPTKGIICARTPLGSLQLSNKIANQPPGNRAAPARSSQRAATTGIPQTTPPSLCVFRAIDSRMNRVILPRHCSPKRVDSRHNAQSSVMQMHRQRTLGALEHLPPLQKRIFGSGLRLVQAHAPQRSIARTFPHCFSRSHQRGVAVPAMHDGPLVLQRRSRHGETTARRM